MGKWYAHSSAKRLLQAHIDWAQQHSWDIEFTPNYLDGVSANRAERMLSNYFDRVETKLFGTYQRFRLNQKLKRFCYQEGGATSGNIHFHCAIALPDFAKSRLECPMTLEEFCRFLKSEWDGQKGAGHFTTCKPIRSFEGFTTYICKKSLADAYNPLLSHL